MKLVHPELSFQIDFSDVEIPIFVVESPIRWRTMQRELLAQNQGADGKWVLSEMDEEIKISKFVEIIINPIQLDENQRRISNAFLQSLSKTASNEIYWKKGQELNAGIQTFFSELEMYYPFEYHINPEIDFPALAKAMGIRIENEYGNELERLVQYCILTQEIMHTKLFIFYHLHDYFTDAELRLLYKEIQTRHWNVLLVEPLMHEKIVGERHYIIDRDNCEIY